MMKIRLATILPADEQSEKKVKQAKSTNDTLNTYVQNQKETKHTVNAAVKELNFSMRYTIPNANQSRAIDKASEPPTIFA